MRAGVIVFPGSNCERETARTLEAASGQKAAVIWHRDTELPPLDLIVLPGGFSHGDYLRSGAMAARAPIMSAVRKAAADGVHVLGICNGFQILVEAGLLPGAFLQNRSLSYICKVCDLDIVRPDTAFTNAYQGRKTIRVPIAHHEGNYTAAPEVLERLEGEGQVVFRYAPPTGNPNGAAADIAGIMNETGRVMGLMPHPERAFDEIHGSTDGRGLFESLVRSLGA